MENFSKGPMLICRKHCGETELTICSIVHFVSAALQKKSDTNQALQVGQRLDALHREGGDRNRADRSAYVESEMRY